MTPFPDVKQGRDRIRCVFLKVNILGNVLR
jgi:hypothetical protein